MTDDAAHIREGRDEPIADGDYSSAEAPPGDFEPSEIRADSVGDDRSADVPLWRRLVMFLLPTRAERLEQAEARLSDLDAALAQHPDSAANYVLRGEVYHQLGEYELAAADFSRALELAAAQVESDDWGLVAQAMQDRAERGLEKARDALRKPAPGWRKETLG